MRARPCCCTSFLILEMDKILGLYNFRLKASTSNQRQACQLRCLDLCYLRELGFPDAIESINDEVCHTLDASFMIGTLLPELPPVTLEIHPQSSRRCPAEVGGPIPVKQSSRTQSPQYSHCDLSMLHICSWKKQLQGYFEIVQCSNGTCDPLTPS